MQKEIADKYQEFFNFMSQEHDLILTIEQMDEIIFEAERFVKKRTIPIDLGDVGESLPSEVVSHSIFIILTK
jgi:hypothetical protein